MDSSSDFDLEFRNVTKLFGDVRAVDEATFQVRRGEFLSLLGPSGCGKTTSLRMIGAFDLKVRRRMQQELKRIHREVGVTFVYVTHDQEEALTMSDRIAVMNHGRIEQLDTPAGVYERPATRFVAGFIGLTNLLRGV